MSSERLTEHYTQISQTVPKSCWVGKKKLAQTLQLWYELTVEKGYGRLVSQLIIWLLAPYGVSIYTIFLCKRFQNMFFCFQNMELGSDVRADERFADWNGNLKRNMRFKFLSFSI